MCLIASYGFYFFQEHTDELETQALNSLYNLVCSMYKVRFHWIQSYALSPSLVNPVVTARFQFLLLPFPPRVRLSQHVAKQKEVLEATARSSEKQRCTPPTGVAAWEKGTLKIFIIYMHLFMVLSLVKGKL